MKKILAVALASAFAAPAFAATSNVDIYGRLHLSVNWYDDQPNSVSDIGISSNASRIGFKGSEDLGGGLKGIWQIESGFNADEQNGTLASRNTFVGLSGGWGTALLGNHDTPLKLVGRKVDLFGDTIGDSRNVMGGGSDTRAQNVAAYISPNIAGFTFAGAYTTDLNGQGVPGTAGDDEDQEAWNVSGEFAQGPFYVGVAYGDGDAHENLANANEHWRVAGGFNFDAFRIVGQYDSLDGRTGNDYDAWMVGGSFTMGQLVFKGNYMEGDLDQGNDPEQFNIGVDYKMSKRTAVYAMYTDGEYVTLGGGAGSSDRVSSGVNGGDISGLSFGVIHDF